MCNFSKYESCLMQKQSTGKSAQTCKLQKQPLEVFCKKRCSWKCRKFTENTYARVSFLIKLQTACNLIKKRDSDTGVFLRILRNFYEYLFYKTPPDGYFRNSFPSCLKQEIFRGKCFSSNYHLPYYKYQSHL